MVAENAGTPPGLALFRALGDRGDDCWFSLRERRDRINFLRKNTRVARRATLAVGWLVRLVV